MIALLDGHGRPFVRGMNGTFGGDIVPQELPFDERALGFAELANPSDAPGGPSLTLPPPVADVFGLDDFVVLPGVPVHLDPPGPLDLFDLPLGPIVMPTRLGVAFHDFDSPASPPPSIQDWWSGRFDHFAELQHFGSGGSDFLFALF